LDLPDFWPGGLSWSRYRDIAALEAREPRR
jgi:hypothetical protein